MGTTKSSQHFVSVYTLCLLAAVGLAFAGCGDGKSETVLNRGCEAAAAQPSLDCVDTLVPGLRLPNLNGSHTGPSLSMNRTNDPAVLTATYTPVDPSREPWIAVTAWISNDTELPPVVLDDVREIDGGRIGFASGSDRMAAFLRLPPVAMEVETFSDPIDGNDLQLAYLQERLAAVLAQVVPGNNNLAPD